MRKGFIALVMTGGLALSAFAATSSTSTFQPCAFWMYYSQAPGYACSYPQPSITVYTAAQVAEIVTSLQRRINKLEARVRTLEEQDGTP